MPRKESHYEHTGPVAALQVTRPYREDDLPAMAEIWNEVVEAGNAFPQTEPLTLEEARIALRRAVPYGRGYGRWAHSRAVHSASQQHRALRARCERDFAVAGASRGEGIGRLLVEDCLRQAAACGFRGLQFNAVVASNKRARALYESLGFARIGMIPGGFRNKDDVYEDMYIYYHPTE